MKKKTLLKLSIISSMFCAVSLTAQTTYHVNINGGNDSNDGLKWSTSFKNLQPAINAAKGSDTILVAAGTYYPTEKIAKYYDENVINPKETDNRHRSFIIKGKSLKIFGGYSSMATDDTKFNQRDAEQNHTVLSGDFDDNDDSFSNTTDNALHVIVMLETSRTTQIDGFIISGGCGSDTATVYVNYSTSAYPIMHTCGGGVYVISVNEASPTISNCTITNNKIDSNGGGLFCYSFSGDVSPKLTNMEITNNVAGERGGGIFLNALTNVEPEITNVKIAGNKATTGGGVYLYTEDGVCSPSISNSLICGNKADKKGGGIFMYALADDASPFITNITICGNYGEGGGLVIMSNGKAQPAIRNSVIWGNDGFSYSNIYILGKIGTNPVYKNNLIEGQDLGSTNLDKETDPKFVYHVSANYAPTIDGDYQLTLESPLINKGDNSVILEHTDILGQKRIYDNTVDIGAYESQGTKPTFNETIFSEKTIWSNGRYLYININKMANLNVYTMNGTLIKQANNLGEGLYEFILPKGLFVVRLSTGETAKIFIK